MCAGLGCRDTWTGPPSAQSTGLQDGLILLTTGLTQAMTAAPAPLLSRLRGTRCPTKAHSPLALNAACTLPAQLRKDAGGGAGEEKKASGLSRRVPWREGRGWPA